MANDIDKDSAALADAIGGMRCTRAETTGDCPFSHKWYDGKAYITPAHRRPRRTAQDLLTANFPPGTEPYIGEEN